MTEALTPEQDLWQWMKELDMARKLTKTEAKKMEQVFVVPKAQSKYPWDEWTDGSTYELTEGEDFTVPVQSFRTQLSQTAKRRGMTVTSHKAGNKLTIRFTPDATTPSPVEAASEAAGASDKVTQDAAPEVDEGESAS